MQATRQAIQKLTLDQDIQVSMMKTATTFLAWAENRFAEVGRARLWAALRVMDDHLLLNAGFEPSLLDQGPDAWPWQGLSQEVLASTDIPIDQRGAPVPIESADRLSQSEPDGRSHPPDSEVRHKAA